MINGRQTQVQMYRKDGRPVEFVDHPTVVISVNRDL